MPNHTVPSDVGEKIISSLWPKVMLASKYESVVGATSSWMYKSGSPDPVKFSRSLILNE